MDINKEMALYLIEAKKQDFALTTFNSYKASIKAFLKHFEQKESPSEVSLKEFINYLDNWPNPNTKYVKINSLKSFYKLREINAFDFESFEQPKRIKKMPKRIPREFLLESINEIDNRKHKALLSLSFSTGIWLSEILNLELEDIDFDNRTILVRNRDEQKNRNVILSDEVAVNLLHYIKKFKPIRFLFNGQFNIQYDKNSALNVVKKCIGKQYNFLTIRNTHIYCLIEAGANNNEILEHLGLYGTESVKRLNQFKKHTIKDSFKSKLPL